MRDSKGRRTRLKNMKKIKERKNVKGHLKDPKIGKKKMNIKILKKLLTLFEKRLFLKEVRYLTVSKFKWLKTP